jgi:hypothetical protein
MPDDAGMPRACSNVANRRDEAPGALEIVEEAIAEMDAGRIDAAKARLKAFMTATRRSFLAYERKRQQKLKRYASTPSQASRATSFGHPMVVVTSSSYRCAALPLFDRVHRSRHGHSHPRCRS